MARNPKKKRVKKSSKGHQNVPILDGESSEQQPVAAEQQQQPTRVWVPGVDNLEDGEELQFDPTAYDCLHAFRLQWPCLSFDIARDALGVLRNDFPHTMFCVAGTQADLGPNNSIVVAKLSNVTGVRRGLKLANPMDADEHDGSDDDSSSDEEDDGKEGRTTSSKVPVLQARMIAHQGGVNRIRAMPQQPHIVATWADTGYVQVWDMLSHVRALSTENPSEATAAATPSLLRQAPLHIFTGHKDEGFALDWSPVNPGRLVTGDCKSGIHLWEPTTSGKWNVDRAPFKGHTASVEDLQWSPTEGEVFASCSVDGTLRIWDARTRSQPAISVKAHDADVNVISWNRVASCMVASGCDDGTFRIWDLRSFKEDSFVAHFNYHKAPITSIEWSPHEASTVAVTCADNQLTIWDLSLERDEEEEAEYQARLKQQQAEAPTDLPPQLLFVHLGQKDIKEAHWHPQIQGLLVSTAADGFNIIRPSNLENLPAAV
ncbi:ribosome assembly protein RRB1 [Marchantia polymorpha subsp. ruderalis]|uniref:Glutamate-rich WD repeat-containing protein 1 n=2 Tax=Marchantia polymorpha TaxID=3197 RepID=A0AAF6BCB9_MARPO|nr:hypothetical protein MARPO_0090s0067 [Marchantia polymorpha]BBN09653.1 hypothetical protein Mp_4g21540 [Marchantia polymorpha subsp. ruderalis]|eukprot:PTQ33333.1 hypothetical protein MARPO_0090s0067 [Marchantia polymorpha]